MPQAVRICTGGVLLAFFLLTSCRELSPANAAAKYVGSAEWRSTSEIAGDFTCTGRMGHAILGIDHLEIVIAIFPDALNEPPKILRDSARNAQSAKLTAEGLDYDLKDVIGGAIPGFQRSEKCQGLVLDDGEKAARHIFWNHDFKEFDSWAR
jgi:hypothetical protein